MKRLVVAIGLILTVAGILISSLSFPVSWALTLGLVILFSGFGWIAYGVKPPASSQRNIFLGYVFAALGGFFGVFIGKYILEKESPDEHFHGKVVLALGIVSLIAYVLLWFLL